MARGGFSTTIEYEGGGLNEALAGLRNFRRLGNDLTPFMEDAAAILLSSTLLRFNSGRGPNDIPWAPTKRQNTSAVGKRGPNKAGILVDTGDLRASIRAETTNNSVEVGSDGLTDPVKAIANQFGSHRQAVVLRHKRTITMAFGAPLAEPVTVEVRPHGRITNLPARPFIGIDARDETNIKEAWQARIIRTFESA